MALTQILGLTLIPVGATLLGGAIATFRVPSARARSLLQHFAAGVVMAVVAGELLPEMTREHRPLGVLIGFALGVGLMLGVKAMAQRIEGRGEQGGSGNFGLLVTVGIDVLLDGVLIGVGFAAGERVGTLLIVALMLELLFLGVSVAASLGEAKVSRTRTLLTVAGLSALVIVGAALGGSLLAGLSGLALETVLSFGAAALMYLVVEELLTEAHEVQETPLITASFFAGFVALDLLELMG
ncbi:MAG: transporter [Piscinibacter sp.]|uniref:ZIP family metal transporter n=1 Tax=Piscinibacter TaxID=1114981 RepID=UPI000FDE81A0|nr:MULTISPECIES: transporter [Piscinibacter]MCW5662317.1 transporter [Piscinibacter sp.]